MSCLRGNFAATPKLRIRPVPEWDGCVVYDPQRRRLVELNLCAWLVLELCDGETFQKIRDKFALIVGSRIAADERERHLISAILLLGGAGLVRREIAARAEKQGPT